jgi:hypothetical protein
MRLFALLAFVPLAAADVSLHKQAHCVVDGGEAASDLMDAAIFIWGAKQRCGVDGLQVKCEIDIASATESLMSMTNTILKIVGRCGHDYDPRLGRAVTRLIKALAGLSAANGGIKQKCFETWKTPGPCDKPEVTSGSHWVHGDKALCVLDVKNSAKNLLKTVKYFVKMEKKCKHPGSHKCARNTMKSINGLLALGEWLAATIGDCRPPSKMTKDAECSQEAIMLVHHLVKVAEASAEIHWFQHCSEDSDCGPGYECKHHKCEAESSRRRRRRRKGGSGGGGDETDVINGTDSEARIYQEQFGPWAPDNMFDGISQPGADNLRNIPRLYNDDDDEETSEKSESAPSYTNLILGAFLPVTAIVGFVGGRLYSRRTYTSTRVIVPAEE